MNNLRRLRAALVALVVVTAALVTSGQAAHADPNWWNASYSHRLAINVYANDAITSGYSLDVVFNHAAMVVAGNALASGDDVRVVRFDGTTFTELDRVLAWGSSWNANNTDLVFKTQAAVNANTNDTSYWLYFGNGGAVSPPANANNVYPLFDDFSSGTLDSAKWTVFGTQPGVAQSITAGALTFSGARTGTGQSEGWSGITLNTGFGMGYRSDVSFAISQSTPAIANTWKAMTGAYEQNFTNVGSPRGISNWYPYFARLGTSTLTSQTFTSQRISSTRLPVSSYKENGALIAQNFAPSGVSDGWFAFDPGTFNAAFSISFDDIVIRRVVTNEPRVSIDQSNDIAFVASVAPVFSFTVAAHTGVCNGVAMSNGSATASTLNLSRVTAGANAIAAQDLSVATNANLGFTVGTKYSGLLTSGSNTVVNAAGTNASPVTFSSPGTAAFGYTTSDLSRFTVPSAKWSAFTTNSADVLTSSGAITKTGCIAVQAGVSPSTPAGTYSTTVYYSAAPTF